MKTNEPSDPFLAPSTDSPSASRAATPQHQGPLIGQDLLPQTSDDSHDSQRSETPQTPQETPLEQGPSILWDDIAAEVAASNGDSKASSEYEYDFETESRATTPAQEDEGEHYEDKGDKAEDDDNEAAGPDMMAMFLGGVKSSFIDVSGPSFSPKESHRLEKEDENELCSGPQSYENDFEEEEKEEEEDDKHVFAAEEEEEEEEQNE